MKQRTPSVFSKIALLLAFAMLSSVLASCKKNEENSGEKTTEPTTEITTEVQNESLEAPTDTETESEPDKDSTSISETETVTETETETVEAKLDLHVNMYEMSELMCPIFEGNTVSNETVLFLDPGDAKSLLYPIDSILSVTSYNGQLVYKEGVNYKIVDGKLQMLEGSYLPRVTSEAYYNLPEDFPLKLYTEYEGQKVLTLCGDMTPWQVNVTYTHSSTWEGYRQKSEWQIYEAFIEKLKAGEDVTIFFYGDSITHGANASWQIDQRSKNKPHSMLFTEGLADLFDYTVHYIPTMNTAEFGELTCLVPENDYVSGTRGTITYINTAVGGWDSAEGLRRVDAHVSDLVKEYGCDLFVLGFGMNDNETAPETVASNIKKIAKTVFDLTPETSVMMVSTMVPNPNAKDGWYYNQDRHEPYIQAIAKEYREQGLRCGVTCMTSVSQAVLTRKEFVDYSSNNINHPNDFFIRIYAQTLMQALIGYENMERTPIDRPDDTETETADGTVIAEWNVLDEDFSDGVGNMTGLNKATYSVTDGILRIEKSAAIVDCQYDLPEAVTSGRLVAAARVRTNAPNLGFLRMKNGKTVHISTGTNGAGNYFVKGSTYTILPGFNDENWHELLVVVDLDAKTLYVEIDGAIGFNGTLAEHANNADIAAITNIDFRVHTAAGDGGYMEIDYFRVGVESSTHSATETN